MPVKGLPSATDLISYFDPIASCVKAAYASIGQAVDEVVPGSYATLADKLFAMRQAAVAVLPSQQSNVDSAASQGRADRLFQQLFSRLVQGMDSQIGTAISNIGWTYIVSGGVLHNLHAHLLRLNAAHTGVPTTPDITVFIPTVSAISATQGQLPSVTAGSAPHIVMTFVGTHAYDESLPSNAFTQTAISGANNAYQVSFPSSAHIPAGVTAVNIYRELFGGPVGTYCLDQTVPVQVGVGIPNITISQADALLHQDCNPPGWLSCPMVPEAAYAIALAFATAPATSLGSGSSYSPLPLVMQSTGMLDPTTVAAGPSNGFLGLGNPLQSAILGTQVLGTGFTAGTLQAANYAPGGIQGFGGAFGIQARATVGLNGTRHPTISYTYYDAAHGFGNVQTQTGITPNSDFAGTGVGETITYPVTAGRIVLSVSETAGSGTATTGTYVYEASPVRSY